MPAAKKAAKGSLRTATPRVVAVGGEPTGRFAQVLAETRRAGLAVDEFDITEDLTLYPPNESRMKALEQYSAAYLLAQSSALSLLRTQGDPPAIPEPKGEPPTDPEQHKAWAAAWDEELKAAYERRNSWALAQQESLRAAYEQANAAEQAFNEALYGGPGVLQEVEEYFADRPDWEKKAFSQAINEQFRRLPHDGRCTACGSEVDQQAGESVGEFSGGSSTSGSSSKGTSPSTSTEPTPETGSEDSAPGPSSSPTPNSLPA